MAKTERKKQQARARMERALEKKAKAGGTGAARPAAPKEPKGYVRHVTGIDWLANKGKLTSAQAAAARTWGRLSRMAGLTDHTVIKSCLSALDGAGGGAGSPTFPGQIDYEAAGAAREAREALDGAKAVLGSHAGMIAALELVCGQEKTPREAVPLATDRELAEVVNALQIALDLLVKYWRENPPPR